MPARIGSPSAMELAQLVTYLDLFLEIGRFSDAAVNGLQVENSGRVEKAGLAVDASLEAIEMAAGAGCGLLLVHHGLLWGPAPPLLGHHYRRVRALIASDMALYAAHLPLDAHPEVGNNVQIALRLDLTQTSPFGRHGGVFVGIQGVWREPHSREQARLRCRQALGQENTSFWFGPETIRRVGVISGSATDPQLFEETRRSGIDLFVTGEPKHAAFLLAREIGLNVFYGGHYHTETFGIRSLGNHIAENLELPVEFIDSPCPL